MSSTHSRSQEPESEREHLLPDESLPISDVRSFTLRIHGDVVAAVDEAVAKHPVLRNRNTWIVNAIVEQLKREGYQKWQ